MVESFTILTDSEGDVNWDISVMIVEAGNGGENGGEGESTPGFSAAVATVVLLAAALPLSAVRIYTDASQ